MKQVLVTGATGFVGRHLVNALINSGVPVRALVRAESSVVVSADTASALLTFVRSDITRGSSLAGVCDGVDAVFHLASYAGAGDDSVDRVDADKHWQVTVEGTRAMLREAVRAGVRRFVFASTVKAMGAGGDGCRDEDAASPPLSGYGRAKREAETLVLKAGLTHGMHACVLRLAPLYGRDSGGLLFRMMVAMDRGWLPPLPNVSNRRSMVHVDDAVRALRLAAGHDQARGRTYIVTDGAAYSVIELQRAISHALGRRTRGWHLPLWLFHVAAWTGDVAGRLCGRSFPFNGTVLAKLVESAWYSSAKIESELGYRPLRTLNEGLREMCEQYQRKA